MEWLINKLSGKESQPITPIQEGGTEPCIDPPLNLLQTVMDEGVVAALQLRGYAFVKVGEHEASLVEQLRQQQIAFFNEPVDEKFLVKSGCYDVESYGWSSVENLKEYYQVC
eukprot:TRINITY_DN1136_c1_g1_i12.p1 TRINITY_DN1136_c1_g1~~TRINITY_DN1136_c1_g1_i12.p1  ORF type:complete len:112 (+),score=26.47 TRINITY_DN1136_c1_g1_i12:199-534(+)